MSKDLEMRERSKFSKICSILVDIFFVPVLIFAFICSITLFSAKSNNRVPKLFGTAMVEVLSNSMYPEFEKGDLLTIKSVNLDQLVVGDEIAFYAPEASGYLYDNGKPMVIFHEIIRIIYPKNEEGVKVRHFVCKGTNVTPETEFVEVVEGVEEGAYRYDSATGKYVSKKDDGNLASTTYRGEYIYVPKLLDDDVKADGNYELDQVNGENMSVYQYVTDENVVGAYSGRVGGLIGGFVKLCTSSIGVLILVIIPSLLMIGLVVGGMIKESKDAKSTAKQDREAINEILNIDEEQLTEDKKKKKKKNKEEDVLGEPIIDNAESLVEEINEEAIVKEDTVESKESSAVAEEKVKANKPALPPKKAKGKPTEEAVDQKVAQEQPKVEQKAVPPRKVSAKVEEPVVEDVKQLEPVEFDNKEQVKLEVKEEQKIVKEDSSAKQPPKKVPQPAKQVEEPKTENSEQKQDEVKAPKTAPKKAPAKVPPKAEEQPQVEVKEEPKESPQKVAPVPKPAPSAPKKAPVAPQPAKPVEEPKVVPPVAPKKAPTKVAPKVEEPKAVPPKKVPPKK